MRPRATEFFLSALILELTNRAFNAISSAKTQSELTRATLETHLRAHLSGALWAGLGLLGIKTPRTTLEFETVLHKVARESGIPELRITNKAVLSNLGKQATIASERLASAGLGNTAAIARGAGFATRWGVQQGIADMAQHSSAVDTGGNDLELLKTWVRLAARHEHRGWHDALEGVTIPYSHLFKIVGPNGTFLVNRPYDSSLPLSEKFACGHGIKVEPPREKATVTLWNGGNVTTSNTPERNAGDVPLPATRSISRPPSGTPISEFITIPDDRKHQTVHNAFSIVDSIHGDGDLENINVRSTRMKDDTLGGYATHANRPDGIVFNTKYKITPATVVEEIGHMLDHQVLAFGQTWASGRSDSDIIDVMDTIFGSPTYQRVANFRLGQSITLQRDGKPYRTIITDKNQLEYEQSKREWFARAYVQFIGIASGNPALLREIATMRSTSNHELLYTRAWQDDEFEPIAQAMERMLVTKGWIR